MDEDLALDPQRERLHPDMTPTMFAPLDGLPADAMAV
jgi:hypothetical protein